MVRSAAGVLGGLAAGPFLDYVTAYGQRPDNYRWMYLWTAVFGVASLACNIAVYILWKKHGGSEGYVAPGSAIAAPDKPQAPEDNQPVAASS
jgi:hypothetical protein